MQATTFPSHLCQHGLHQGGSKQGWREHPPGSGQRQGKDIAVGSRPCHSTVNVLALQLVGALSAVHACIQAQVHAC